MVARGMLAASAALLLLAAVPGRSQPNPNPDPDPDPGAAGCDNRCRMRHDFWFNSGQGCVQFAYSTCLMCAANAALCTNTESTYGRVCRSATGGGNFYYYQASCTPACNGWQQAGRGEATNMNYDNTDDYRTIDRYTCQVSIAGDPPPDPLPDPTEQ